MKGFDTCALDLYKKMKEIFDIDLPLSNYSFSLFLFIKRMVNEAISDGITDLFFLSREGKLLNLLYDKYICMLDLQNCPRSHYLYVSRKAVTNGTLTNIDEERFDSFRVYPRMSIATFCKALDFTEEEMKEIALVFENEMNVEYPSFFDGNVFDKLKNDLAFKTIYEEKRIQNNRNCYYYFVNSGFAMADKPAVVDVGWNGTIQNSIFKMNMHDKLVGYYIGCWESENACKNNVKKGLLFNGKSRFDIFSYYNHNYEYIGVTDHGSVTRYSEDGPIIKDDYDVVLFDKIYSDVQQNILNKFLTLVHVAHVANEKSVDEYIEKYICYFHLRMLNHFDKRERGFLTLSIDKHPDNFVDIYPIHNLKQELYIFMLHMVMKLQKVIYWLDIMKMCHENI